MRRGHRGTRLNSGEAHIRYEGGNRFVRWDTSLGEV